MKKCPVEIGDTFYRSTSRILVRAKYMYHAIGPIFERTFDAKIFDDPRWVIEKRKEKTA